MEWQGIVTLILSGISVPSIIGNFLQWRQIKSSSKQTDAQTLITKIEGVNQAINIWERTSKELELKLVEQKKENTELIDNIKQLRIDLDTYKEENEKLVLKIDEYREQNKSLTLKIEELELKLDKVIKENNILKSKK